MSSADFLARISEKGVQVWVDGDRLRYRAPSEALTEDLLSELRRRKRDLIPMLSGRADLPARWEPLSHGQQALWFLHQNAPDSAAYNVAFSAGIHSEVDMAAMHRTLQTLLDRHPTLRTTYTLRNGRPMQQVHDRQAVDFRQVDAAGLDDTQLSARVARSYRRPFDVESGPVFRAELFTRAAEDHVLLVVIHHIACDGWSLWILQDEFRSVYPDVCKGAALSLPPLESSYADFTRWQEKTARGAEGERHWQYWQNALGGDPPVLDMPTDFRRPKKSSQRGASHTFRISDRLTERLRALARAEDVTLYTVLLGAYQVLLHRYSGQHEILIGSPTSGRSRAESSGVVGYFVNPIVLRGEIDARASFRDHLGSVHRVVISALKHQDYPFPLLVERLRPTRHANRSPLFQAIFALQRPQMAADVVGLLSAGHKQTSLEWGGLRLSPFELAQQEGQFELSLELMETGRSIFALLKYQTDLFKPETAGRLAEHYCRLLEATVADADRPLSALPIMTDDEIGKVLDEFNRTTSEYPRDEPIHRLFELVVERQPDKVALVFGDVQINYRELNNRANRLAHHLTNVGVGPEVKVGICVERSVEMVVGLLAILKAGGAYVPLNPEYPVRRLEFMVEDADIPVLLASRKAADLLVDYDGELVLLDALHEHVATESPDNLAVDVSAGGLAYVMYTSGSTGTPKGVEVVHGGVVRLVRGTNYVELGPDSVVLQFAPLSFDASTFEIWGPLLCGGRLVVFEPGLPSIVELGRFIREHRINTLWLTAGLFTQVVDFGLEYLEQVRQLLVGGDIVSPAHAAKALQMLPNCRLVNGYGPTENTTFTCCHRMDSSAEVGPTVSIGRPIANTRAYVLDDHGQPVPVGMPGELHAAGDGLARGYLNRPELTTERFVDDPFSEQADARMYRTGDIVRWQPDGSLDFLGRRDHQVKVRGFRIELCEIESTLAQHDAVREAVVVARRDRDGENRLIAHVVAAAEPPPADDELSSFLKKRLPGYMVPSAIVLLDELPLTANGKVDRRALPEPGHSRKNLQREYVAPRTATETTLALIWADVLGLDRVGIHDNFFDLGGASIKSLRIVAKAEEAGLAIDSAALSPELLFEHPTVAEIAALIESTDRAGTGETENKGPS